MPGKNKSSISLPKAKQSSKSRGGSSSGGGSGSHPVWTAIVYGLGILIILFILLGGVSQTGVLKFVFNWSHNVVEAMSDWMSGGSIVTNSDGIYIDPTGQKGDKIIDDDAPEIKNIADDMDIISEELGKVSNEDSSDSTESSENNETSNDSEVQNE